MEMPARGPIFKRAPERGKLFVAVDHNHCPVFPPLCRRGRRGMIMYPLRTKVVNLPNREIGDQTPVLMPRESFPGPPWSFVDEKGLKEPMGSNCGKIVTLEGMVP